jgi:hypothetical protein
MKVTEIIQYIIMPTNLVGAASIIKYLPKNDVLYFF